MDLFENILETLLTIIAVVIGVLAILIFTIPSLERYFTNKVVKWHYKHLVKKYGREYADKRYKINKWGDLKRIEQPLSFWQSVVWLIILVVSAVLAVGVFLGWFGY